MCVMTLKNAHHLGRIGGMGKAHVANNSGKAVADGCLVDHLGMATNDPAVMFSDPMGALTYIGEHKGFGLALCCELLAGALVGQWTAQDKHPRPTNVVNHMLTVILDPEVFENVDGFIAEGRKLVSYIKATPPAQGIDSVLIPGEPERMTKKQRLNEGIPVDTTTWLELVETAFSVGIKEADLTSVGLE